MLQASRLLRRGGLPFSLRTTVTKATTTNTANSALTHSLISQLHSTTNAEGVVVQPHGGVWGSLRAMENFGGKMWSVLNARDGQEPGRGQGDNKGNQNQNNNNNNNPFGRFSLGDILMTALIFGGLFFLPGSSSSSVQSVRKMSFEEFTTELLAQGKVHQLVVQVDGRVLVFLNTNPNAAVAFFTIGSVEWFERRLHSVQTELGIAQSNFVKVSYKQENLWLKEIIGLVPTLAIIGVIYVLFSRGMASQAKGRGGSGLFNIGKAKVQMYNKDNHVTVTFKDVAGLFEAKEEIMEFVHFLRSPEKYERLGARLPKGALLVGPPGTGKTLLAKATAGEASVPFFSVSGSDFVEMFVGVGSSRVRDLFAQAREQAPCIVFIDEIDAVGRARAEGGFGGGNDERENTLNQLLVEMDGFNTKHGAVVVLAGTNRADILDRALLRPGRFDRQISIDKPDQKGRVEIFHVHLKPLKLAVLDVDSLAHRLAALTPGFSGADIANVCNEAALIAAREHSTVVDIKHFEAAIERVIGGLERKTKVISKKEKRIVAFHEAGHAVAGWFLENCNPLLKVSIIPRSQTSLGFSQALPREQFLYNTNQLLDHMSMTLAGRAAEELKFGELSTSASDDLQKVTNLALAQVTEFGMNSKIGHLSFRKNSGGFSFEKPYSESTHEAIDAEARRLVNEAYSRVKKLLEDKSQEVDKVAQFLLDNEVANHQNLVELLGERPFELEKSQQDILSAAYNKKTDKTDPPAQPQPSS